jgi:hemerythrin superfamily protein
MDVNTKHGALASPRLQPGSPVVPDGDDGDSTALQMDALAFLEAQHLAVNRLFGALDGALGPGDRRETFRRVADALAIHTAIEERYFYPAIRAAGTEDLLLDSMHEHLEIKRAIVDLVQLSASDDVFEEKLATLRQLVSRHIEADESELFPRVRRLFTRESLVPVLEQMQDEVAQMEGTDARFRVFPETIEPVPL